MSDESWIGTVMWFVLIVAVFTAIRIYVET